MSKLMGCHLKIKRIDNFTVVCCTLSQNRRNCVLNLLTIDIADISSLPC